MPIDDPTEELQEIIDLYHEHKAPEIAYEYATGALETAEEILETIDSMQSNGVNAPTSSQEEALEKIYIAACNWLKREPEFFNC